MPSKINDVETMIDGLNEMLKSLKRELNMAFSSGEENAINNLNERKQQIQREIDYWSKMSAVYGHID